MDNLKKGFDLVFLATPDDIDKLIKNFFIIKKRIVAEKYVVIANLDVKKILVENDLDNEIEFIDENSVIRVTKNNVQAVLENLGGSRNKGGWYFQQFLKLGYADIADRYYMTWDADTVPIVDINMFEDDGKVVFDMKNEYHKEYFSTIKNIFGIDKIAKKSFIAEHMMFDKYLVQQMLDEIEGNEFQGDIWWEKILHAINVDDIGRNGFSEFETYGTWVMTYHPEEYCMRNYNSFRLGNSLMNENYNKNEYEWMAERYSAISFEAWDCGLPWIGVKFGDVKQIPFGVKHFLVKTIWKIFFIYQALEWRLR